VIVSNLASACEWISDGVSGLVVAPRRADELAAAMLRLCASADLRRELGARALAVARREAGFADNLRNVERIFTHLTTGGPWPIDVSLAALRRQGRRNDRPDGPAEDGRP
jgi:glycosyltransferase involved in cell wall biosynthesis